jgi:hypothetical protein
MSVAESRKTKADFEREIATLRARIKEKEALMNRSGESGKELQTSSPGLFKGWWKS